LKTVETLKAARAKIEKRDNWIKGTSFMRRGLPGELIDCYCSSGAVVHSAVDGEACADAHEALAVAAGTHIVLFNDREATTHSDVLAVFDKAIAAEEAKAA
jgi:hypothetical protein